MPADQQIGIILIRFAPHQPLPPGYTIQWWERDEHYHWVLSDNVYSDCDRDRWAARRGAWAHYRRSAEAMEALSDV